MNTAQKHVEAARISQNIRAMDPIALQRRIISLLNSIDDETALGDEEGDDFYAGRVMAFRHALSMLSDLDDIGVPR